MKKTILLICTLFFLLCQIGCGVSQAEGKRGKDYDFTVVKEVDIPEILKKQVDENKINSFELSYTDGEFLYIAVGYGEQESGGYSIQVEGLYGQGEKVRFVTKLIGPNEKQVVKKKPTTPYIVVKMENVDKLVEFETV